MTSLYLFIFIYLLFFHDLHSSEEYEAVFVIPLAKVICCYSFFEGMKKRTFLLDIVK